MQAFLLSEREYLQGHVFAFLCGLLRARGAY